MGDRKDSRAISGNLFAALPALPLQDEVFEQLYAGSGVRVERIVSTGQRSGDDDWYDQADDEWVVLLSGAAGLLIEGETADRLLKPGDWLLLPAHCRHRVTWTQEHPATVWLAIHAALK